MSLGEEEEEDSSLWPLEVCSSRHMVQADPHQQYMQRRRSKCRPMIPSMTFNIMERRYAPVDKVECKRCAAGEELYNSHDFLCWRVR